MVLNVRSNALSTGRERQVLGDGGVGDVGERWLALDVDVDVRGGGREVGHLHLSLSTLLRKGRCCQRERREQRQPQDEYLMKDVAQQ